MQLEQLEQQSLLQRLVAMISQWIDWLLTILRQPYQAVETFLIAVIGGWAAVFYLNPNLFALSELYDPMSDRGTPGDWGRRAAGLCVWWCVARAMNNSTLRVLAQLSLIWWYAYLMILFGSSGVVSFGAVFHGIAFVYSVWVLWRYEGRTREA